MLRVWAKNHSDMKFLRKFLSFTLENLNGKLIFRPFFLLFSMVPEAVGEFFAFYFFSFAVGGGEFFRLVWNSGGLGGGRVPPPRVNVWAEACEASATVASCERPFPQLGSFICNKTQSYLEDPFGLPEAS